MTTTALHPARLVLVALAAVALLLPSLAESSRRAIAQDDPFGAKDVKKSVDDPKTDAPAKQTDAKKADDKKADEKKADETPPPVAPPPKEPVDPSFIRLNLNDGSAIAGKLTISHITLDTEFGKLQVPIEKIKRFMPGLNSLPELNVQVNKLIDDLAASDYKSRETAQQELLQMGASIRKELQRRLDDPNAERVRRLKAIIEKLDESKEEDDDGSAASKELNQGDTVETTEFTVVGKITPDNFSVQSKYGLLNVRLADVKSGQRDVQVESSEQRKNLAVDGTYLAPTRFKSSDLRVERGDKVTITADGTIIMSPWGSSTTSTPDGSSQFGLSSSGKGIYGGALVGRIGANGAVFKAGSKSTFTATSSGVLQFGIAMRAEYATGGYQYPGQYNLKIKVEKGN